MVRRPKSRTARAIGLGTAAYLTTTLLVLFVAMPVWAGQNEFPGHAHPTGTPDHVHNLNQVGLLSVAAVSHAIYPVFRQMPDAVSVYRGAVHLSPIVGEGTWARAPPG